MGSYSSTTSSSAESDLKSVKLPGLGLPLNFLPPDNKHFPIFHPDQNSRGWRAATLLNREVCMLKVVEEITNKPEWWRKIKDSSICNKWIAEVLEMDWATYRQHADFTSEMAQHCMDELLQKAELYEKTGLIPIFDYSSCIIKSDNSIPNDLRDALMAAVAPFENVPENHKDWHPGSDDKVLDLVHPSLWPLVYGRSRVLPNKRITRDNCLEHCGMGQMIPEPPAAQSTRNTLSWQWLELPGDNFVSHRFQWLPCDVSLENGKATIDSYINNLHPVDHAALYPIIERFIEKALPAWDIIYRWNKEFSIQRLTTLKAEYVCTTPAACSFSPYECIPASRPLNQGELAREEEDDDARWHSATLFNKSEADDTPSDRRNRLDLEWFYQNHPMKLPSPSASLRLRPEDVKSSGFFEGASTSSKIQVIVKLANIHLTPEKPTYDGGSWHTEGQLNEHICATALFYYDSDNITDCHLDFRTTADKEDLSVELSYEQGEFDAIARVFAIRPDDDVMQDVGSVLTRPGRAIFFPNLLQHHVSPFRLADPTRPGHRKILALFLVDPAIPVISTSMVPPQRQDWWVREARVPAEADTLPQEVMDIIWENVEFPIHEREAKRIRQELIEERKSSQKLVDNTIRSQNWSFCEH